MKCYAVRLNGVTGYAFARNRAAAKWKMISCWREAYHLKRAWPAHISVCHCSRYDDLYQPDHGPGGACWNEGYLQHVLRTKLPKGVCQVCPACWLPIDSCECSDFDVNPDMGASG